MAVYTKPIGVERIAGSRKGATFTRTANGFIIRKRYMPKSSKNVKTTANRAKFLTSVQRLRSLNPVQQETFETEAPGFVRTNSLGVPYALTGIQLASSQSFNRLQINQPLPSTASPPIVITPPVALGGGFNANPPLLTGAFTPSPVPAGFSLLALLSPIGIYRINAIPFDKLRIAMVLSEGATSSIDLLPAYIELFGTPNWTIGNQIVRAFQLVDNASGQKSDFGFHIAFAT